MAAAAKGITTTSAVSRSLMTTNVRSPSNPGSGLPSLRALR